MKKKITNIGAVLVVLAILAFNLKTTFSNDSQRYNLSLGFLTASADGSSGSGSESGSGSLYGGTFNGGSGNDLVKASTMCSDGTTYATGCITDFNKEDGCSYWDDTQLCQPTIECPDNTTTIGNTVATNETCVNLGHNWYDETALFKTCTRCGMSVPKDTAHIYIANP